MRKSCLHLGSRRVVRIVSKYTTEIRFICESEAGLKDSSGYSKVKDIIEAARQKIFDFDYPIYDKNHRAELETKILRHYYTREIGFETYGLWKLKLEMKMTEIMPYFNTLYAAGAEQFGALDDVNYQIKRDGALDTDRTTQMSDHTTDHLTSSVRETSTNDSDTSENTSTESSGSSNGQNLFSDTPQGSIQNIQDMSYLTNATLDNNTASSRDSGERTTNTSSNGSVNRNVSDSQDIEKQVNQTEVGRDVHHNVDRIKGKQGSGMTFAELMWKARQWVIDVDMMVIQELDDLFMGIW